MDFHETRGGHEFYYGTMPAIKQNLAALTVAVESLTEAVNNINATLNQQQRPEKEDDIDFSLPEFKGRIVDVFEDFCDANDISIENPDRDEEEDDGAAIIYGEDYDTIADEVEFLFERFKAPFESQEVITTVTNCCGNFEEILQERGSKILEDDSELYDKCMEVFKAYNLIAA